MTTRSLLLLLAGWALVGIVTAFLMRRRGHDFWVWLALGVVLGPLIIPLAIERIRFHSAAELESRLQPTPPHEGFDLLAGLDGSEESIRAIETALDLFGSSVTSVTLVTVLDYDSASEAAGPEPREEARAMLEEAKRRLGSHEARTEILFGRADVALAECARTHGAELIVVGPRGHGATEAFFGSITEQLVGECEIPVYVGPTLGSEED
jgi:nucleotide-binding universal stress UspA family protein